MLNVVRGVVGALLGALLGGGLLAVTWWIMDWMGGPLPGAAAGLYFSVGLGTVAGMFLGLGTRARLGFGLRSALYTLGVGAAGLALGHVVGRLVYGAQGGGWLETLGALEPAARMGIYALTTVGGLVGVVSGSVLAGAGMVPRPKEPSALDEGDGPDRLAAPGGTAKKSPEKKGKAPSTDEIPEGRHPADTMSVEELLGEGDGSK